MKFVPENLEEFEDECKKTWRNFQLRADEYYSLKVAFRRFIIDKSKLLNILNKIEKEE